ncbi:MAG: hypothetical protein AB1736_09620 [Chloroflexota bacterium]
MRRLILMAAIIVAMAAPAAVNAAAPDNDLPGGAIALDSVLPQAITQDTTEATVSTDDIGCGAGGVDQASVWYTFSPDVTGDVLIDASGSDYFVGINVFAGSADPAFLYTCFGPAGMVFLEAGVTYYLMFADANEDEVNGGRLDVLIDVPPPPIEINLTIDGSGKIDRTGAVTVSGTLTCSATADYAEIYLTVSQSVGRFRIHGSAWTPSACVESPTPWAATIVGDNGTFAGGKATVVASAWACDPFSCNEAYADRNVRLRR